MADIVANISLGRIAQYAANVQAGSPANAELLLVVFEAAEADDTLRDYDTLAAVLGGANDEWTSPEYAREILTGVTVTVDDSANDVDIDCDDLADPWAGPTGNDTVKAGIFYDPDTTGGTDADLIPLAYFDFVLSPDGNAVNVTVPANGFAGAS